VDGLLNLGDLSDREPEVQQVARGQDAEAADRTDADSAQTGDDGFRQIECLNADCQ